MIDRIDFSLLIAQSKYKRKEICKITGIKYPTLSHYAVGGSPTLESAMKLLRLFGYKVPDYPIGYIVSCYNKVTHKTSIREYSMVNMETLSKWRKKNTEPKFRTYIDFLNSIEEAEPLSTDKSMFKPLEKI